MRITNIYFNRQEVETSDGKLYSIGVTQTENKTDIFKIQIRETIKNHLSKQDKLGNRIKGRVLAEIFWIFLFRAIKKK